MDSESGEKDVDVAEDSKVLKMEEVDVLLWEVLGITRSYIVM